MPGPACARHRPRSTTTTTSLPLLSRVLSPPRQAKRPSLRWYRRATWPTSLLFFFFLPTVISTIPDTDPCLRPSDSPPVFSLNACRSFQRGLPAQLRRSCCRSHSTRPPRCTIDRPPRHFSYTSFPFAFPPNRPTSTCLGPPHSCSLGCPPAVDYRGGTVQCPRRSMVPVTLR